MDTFIALFRGINVGGKHILPMKDLKTILEEHGCKNVMTYIQSGNVVFQREEPPGAEIGLAIEEKFGFKPEMLLLDKNELLQALANSPYTSDNGKTVHYYFCASTPTAIKTDKLEALKAASEEYAIIDKVFYLHAPNGVGRSKLATNVEQCLGVSTTARNLNTINKLVDLAQKV